MKSDMLESGSMAHQTETITLSIVSHSQACLIRALFSDLAKMADSNFEVVLTINIPEDESFYDGFDFPIRVIRNTEPKGFGANHNAAFAQSRSKWFAIVNPDIRMEAVKLHTLLLPFDDEEVAAVAPLVVSGADTFEDNARRFPTVFQLFKRVVLRRRNLDYLIRDEPYDADWVAGMFVVFRRVAYEQIAGFDSKRFFMYMEDVDICQRLRRRGWRVVVTPHVSVRHLAQRASRRSFRHMRWHVISTLRYLSGL